MPDRRFPSPWSVEETDACYIVRDANGRGRSPNVYFEDEPGRRAAAKLLTHDEARRIGSFIIRRKLVEQRHAYCLFDIAVVEISAPAQLVHDASQERPARLSWQHVGGCRDYAKLTVRYRDHVPLST